MKTQSVATAKATIQKKTPVPVVKMSDVLENVRLYDELSSLRSEANRIEKDFKANNAKLVELIFGIDASELKKLSPSEVEELFEKRKAQGKFEIDGGDNITVINVHKSTSPAWKTIVQEMQGEAFVLEVQKSTPSTYTYLITV